MKVDEGPACGPSSSIKTHWYGSGPLQGGHTAQPVR